MNLSRVYRASGVLGGLAIASVFFVWGFEVGRYEAFPFQLLESIRDGAFQEPESGPSMWNSARGFAEELTAEGRKRLDQLAALPYLRGSTPAPQAFGVTAYDPEASFDGFNLYDSGHAPEAFLIDMKGRVLHQWHYPFERVWSEPLGFEEWPVHKTFWRRVHLFPNGDLLAIFEGIGLVKIDRDSGLLWAQQCRAHHDLDVTDDGTIYVLTRQSRRTPEGVPAETESILEDFVSVLSSDGGSIRRVSILDAFRNSDYAGVLDRLPDHADIFHTNTIEILDANPAHRHPAFQEGRALVSLAMLNTIAVVDLDEERVVWAMSGMFGYQHQPTLLANGNMLLFDNVGMAEYSRVIEFDPMSQRISWSYTGSDEAPFFSRTSGSNQRLPNGNTLIVESNAGRAFEVTPERGIVWEFFSPHRAGEENELVATLFDCVRISKEFFLGQQWLSLGHGPEPD